MDCKHAGDRFVTARVDDNVGGSSAIELFRLRGSARHRVARVIYWDAVGQFYLDSMDPEIDVPVVIIEALIAEARLEIKTR
jgi:hypothetical protein